jgi:putative transposase
VRVILAHKIALNPTRSQLGLLLSAVGTARFAYNWALTEWKRQYSEGGKPSEAALRRQLNAIKRDEYPWMLDVPKSVVQQAIKNLGKAFSLFFKKRNRYPKYKRKGRHDSARFDNGPGSFMLDGKRIRLPVIGWVKMRECLRFDGRPISATVSRTADRWFVSIQVEFEVNPLAGENQAAVGVDFGLHRFAMLSTREMIEAPKPLKRLLAKLRRLSKSLSRKVKDSSNWYKARRQIARLHARIANIRQDFLHKFTTDLVRKYGHIGIEDLNVSGMMRNHKLARAISDVGWYGARRMLGYKCLLYGAELHVYNRWFASSKTCSCCGVVNKGLRLKDRTWKCDGCGTTHDRDVNAAINLKPTAASCAVSACGADSSGRGLMPKVKLSAAKQEPSCIT